MTSVGLRESFIIAETTIFLVGFNFLIQEIRIKAYVLLFLGSYDLISTKNYLWACLVVAVIISSIIFLRQGFNRRKIMQFLVSGFLSLLIVFASTTSAYAVDFILHSNISDSAARSGDFINQIYIDSQGSGKELVTFHVDYTLIALYFT